MFSAGLPASLKTEVESFGTFICDHDQCITGKAELAKLEGVIGDLPPFLREEIFPDARTGRASVEAFVATFGQFMPNSVFQSWCLANKKYLPLAKDALDFARHVGLERLLNVVPLVAPGDFFTGKGIRALSFSAVKQTIYPSIMRPCATGLHQDMAVLLLVPIASK